MSAKKLFTALLCAALVLALLPAAAQAESYPDNLEFDVSEGDLTISNAGDGNLIVTYGTPANTTAPFPNTQNITITGTTATNTVTAESGVVAHITLNGMRIYASSGECAFELEGNASVSLTLSGASILKSGLGKAGLQVPENAALTISGAGALTAASTIDTINGTEGAGIGGAHGGKNGAITISGGTVTATSINGAGIGGGHLGDGGSIEISGGTVITYSNYGAGIGGSGGTGYGGSVVISGGTVITNSNYGAGIGGGATGYGGSVVISGGTVTSESINGAGIGSGYLGESGSVVISGGTVTSESSYGAGIGSGFPAIAVTTVITGGSIKANGGTLAIQGTPTNGADHDNQSLSLAKITIPGITAATRVTALTIPTASYYGTDDIYTDDDGKLYLWLPSGAVVQQARTADTAYDNVSDSLVADTAKPSVTGISPAGPDAAPGGDIVITFNEEMRSEAGSVCLNVDAPLSGGSWNAGKTVYTVPYSGLAYDTAYTVTVSGFADYSGNVMDPDSDYSFTTVKAHPPEPDYIPRTLIDQATGVSVSGSLIHKYAALSAGDLALHSSGNCAASDVIRQRMGYNDHLFLQGKDISLSRGFKGTLTITMPVGAKYNGQIVTILHCAGGALHTYTATVTDGKAVFSVTELSPFAVFASSAVDIPKTGDSGSTLGLWLLCAGTVTIIAELAVNRKRKKTV
ncbi:MAG: hypothetical protein BWY11_01051 [Firmicutes bacterium ADurb.Bin182]|nr:MAG: hypothetical protein BWY11_01051 [Firmicutes bacterium ADurb.Bin182]